MKTSTKKTKDNRGLRINIIVPKNLLDDFNKRVPAGNRSRYISELIEQDLEYHARKEVWDHIQSIKKNNPLRMTMEEVIALKNYGRK